MSSLFDGVSADSLMRSVPGARQFSSQRGKLQWVGHVAGRSVGEFPSMRKALEAAKTAKRNELRARGFACTDEFGESV